MFQLSELLVEDSKGVMFSADDVEWALFHRDLASLQGTSEMKEEEPFLHFKYQGCECIVQYDHPGERMRNIFFSVKATSDPLCKLKAAMFVMRQVVDKQISYR